MRRRLLFGTGDLEQVPSISAVPGGRSPQQRQILRGHAGKRLKQKLSPAIKRAAWARVPGPDSEQAAGAEFAAGAPAVRIAFVVGSRGPQAGKQQHGCAGSKQTSAAPSRKRLTLGLFFAYIGASAPMYLPTCGPRVPDPDSEQAAGAEFAGVSIHTQNRRPAQCSCRSPGALSKRRRGVRGGWSSRKHRIRGGLPGPASGQTASADALAPSKQRAAPSKTAKTIQTPRA